MRYAILAACLFICGLCSAQVVNTTDVQWADNVSAIWGTGADASMTFDATNSVFATAGAFVIQTGGTTEAVTIDAAGDLNMRQAGYSALALSTVGASHGRIKFRQNFSMQDTQSGHRRFAILSGGGAMISNINLGDTPTADGTLHVMQSDATVDASGLSPTAVFERNGTASIVLASDTNGQARVYFGDSVNIDGGIINYNNSSNSMAFFTADSEAMRIDAAQRVGILTSDASKGQLTVGGGGAVNAIDGALHLRNVDTDDTPKYSFIHAGHHTNSDRPLHILSTFCSNSLSFLDIGGGSSATNAATQLRLYTAPNNRTATGIEALRIDSAQRIIIPNMPTSDPNVAGALWNDNGTVKISAGP